MRQNRSDSSSGQKARAGGGKTATQRFPVNSKSRVKRGEGGGNKNVQRGDRSNGRSLLHPFFARAVQSMLEGLIQKIYSQDKNCRRH